MKVDITTFTRGPPLPNKESESTRLCQGHVVSARKLIDYMNIYVNDILIDLPQHVVFNRTGEKQNVQSFYFKIFCSNHVKLRLTTVYFDRYV